MYTAKSCCSGFLVKPQAFLPAQRSKSNPSTDASDEILPEFHFQNKI